ncbi:putative uncharacterized protein [Clostridium sp. CAG:678]|nr:putative uncharacterized protein [Clostridium sp. CAG:678]
MNNNTVKLQFDKAVTRLAGYEFGVKTYEDQINGKINFNELPITIEFPEQIVRVASSFAQGFFKALTEKFGYNLIGKEIILKSENQSLIDSIINNLL